MIRKLLILVSLSFVVITGFSQSYKISGRLISSVDSLPIENVHVTVVGKPIGAISNTEGFFSLEVSSLPAHLFFSHLGYSIDQILLTEPLNRVLEVVLVPEITNIDEVVVTQRIVEKVQLGDTLNVIDYCIIGDRILLVASPYRSQLDQRLYLTDLSGIQIDNFPLKGMGRSIKVPEDIAPKYMFLYEDFMSNRHILTKDCLYEVNVSGDSICIGQKTSYPDFLKYLLPNKLLLGSSLFYQSSSRTLNITERTGPDARRPQIVKKVYDPKGVATSPYDPSRYVELQPRDRMKTIYKNVSSPIIAHNNEAYIFDFFKNHIEVFDSLGKSQRVIPIEFHQETYRFFLNLFSATDLNQKEFKQRILVDSQTEQIYALFNPIGKRVVFKEINPENGKVVKEVEIPDLPNVSNFCVFNSTVYFMYHVMTYPYYTNLYRLKI